LATFFVAGYAGISVPVIGAGVAIQFLSPRLTLLLFGIGVVGGLLCASPVLIRRRARDSRAAEIVVRLDGTGGAEFRQPTDPAAARR
jgi:hypothetical protein